jgi:transposase
MNQSSEQEWTPVAHVGIDWAENHHHVSVCAEGRLEEAADAEIGAKPEQLQEWLEALLARYPEGKIAIYLESTRNSLRYFLMGYERLVLYLIPTTSSKNFRAALYPSGAKSDPVDSGLILQMGYRHRDHFRSWQPEPAEIRQLQTVVEDRRQWVEKRKGQVQQLRQALRRYYPQVIDILKDLSQPWAWSYLQRWPRLEQMGRVRPEVIQRWLQRQGCRKIQQRVQQIQQMVSTAVPMTTDPATIESMVMRVQALTASLQVVDQIVADYDQQIEKLFRAQADAPVFESFPGAGRCLAPRLVALWGTDRNRFQDSQEVSQWTGIAPVQSASGKQSRIAFRRACPRFLRQTLHEFAGQSRRFSPWAQAHYRKQRALGKGHHCAIRSLAFKWTRILYRCWKDRTPYQEHLHLEALRKRRSPVLEFLPPEAKV